MHFRVKEMITMRSVLYLMLAARLLPAVVVEALPEFSRPDPFGGTIAADGRAAFSSRVSLSGARDGYVSCHLVVKLPQPGAYSLTLTLDAPLQAELHREWFHRVEGKEGHYPDALVPVRSPYRGSMPDPENRIEGQSAQAFWLDIWIPADTRPGLYRGSATAEAAGKRSTVPVEVRVLPLAVPAHDAVTMDHNSYGSNWLASQYPAARRRAATDFYRSDELFRLIHAHHRIFYEHRGIFHQLGYGHGGKVGPEFAPVLEGAGRRKRVADWGLFDRHYGPLADGSAFAGTRRGARPIPYAYLPINPEWPASFLSWGEPGYETEFVNVVSEMERHFREKGWTATRWELFFNHKKRYKAFPWDGDETRFEQDLPYFHEYVRLMRKAMPAGSPVKWVFRTDASWMMERQFKELDGVIDLWACGGGMLSWYQSGVKSLKDRGRIVWAYGGPPAMTSPAIDITLTPLRMWMWGIDGFIHWLTVSPGADPWFRSDGGETALVYPGERFGVDGPIPSVRLKLQRNAVQDINLLQAARADRVEVARRYNGTLPEQWWTPRPAIADGMPHDWSNADIDEAPRPYERFFTRLDPDAWQRVRQLAQEAK